MKRNLLLIIICQLAVLNSMAQLNYERKQDFNFKNYLESFVPGDLNNDGRNDLVFSYSNENYMAYRINQSDPDVSTLAIFGDMKMIKLDKKSSKRKLLICDINNDTYNDLLFAEYDNNRIGVAINNGQSLFNEIKYFNTGSKPTKMLTGDFNGDHIKDLAVICEGGKQVSIYLGNTTTLFNEPDNYSTTGTPSDMELQDMNNDGLTDIMVSDLDNAKLLLFTGNANGTFTKGMTLTTNTLPVNLEIADFDGDQMMDVACVSSNSTQVQLFYKLENGTYSSSTHASAIALVSNNDFIVADFNSDGYMDMAFREKANAKMEFILGKSGNQFNCIESDIFADGTQQAPQGFYMKSVWSTNKLTFLFTNAETNAICENQLNADYSMNWSGFRTVSCTNVFYTMQIVDMNKDGIMDLVFNNDGTNSLALYYGKSDQTYEYIKNIPISFYANKIAVSDINQDGYPDIITSGYFQAEVMINDGTNNFSHKVMDEYGQAALVVMDVNKNGNPDLLLNNSLYLDVKDGNFDHVVTFEKEYTLYSVSSMDFNHDGNTDLAFTDYQNSKLTIYPGNGDGTFGQETVLNQRFDRTAIGDIDMDGYDDIVGKCIDESSTFLYRNNKMGGFVKEFLPQSTRDGYSLYVLDFDHDGKNEIVNTSADNNGINMLKYYPINTDGNIGEAKTYPNCIYGTSDMALADLDGDGSQDLLMLTYGALEIHRNKIKANLALKNLVQTYDGLQVDDLASATIPAGLATTMKFNNLDIRPKNAGTYRAVVSIVDDLYKATIDTVLVVQKAVLTVKAADKVKDYGAANPAFKLTYSGFVNGESADFIDVPPTVSSSATQDSDAGTYPIVVSGGMDNNYRFDYQDGTMTINKLKLMVQVENQSRKYGEQNPSFNVTYTGFVNGEKSTQIDQAPIVSTTATTESPVGTYDIVASEGLDNNYSFDYLKGTLTIGKATLVVTAEDKTRKYGEQNPEFTISYNGFANNESEQVIDQLPTLSSTATQQSPVGTYDIIITGGSDNNYTFLTEAGHMNITKANLVLTAEDKSRIYGQENPKLTLSASGFVNGESLSVIDQLPEISTTATRQSPVDGYDIDLSGGQDNNYNFELLKGRLTVDKALLTFTAEDKTRRQGEVNPEFTFTISGFVNNETAEVINQMPDISSLADQNSVAGMYSIDLNGGSDNNYLFKLINGNLKVDYPLAADQLVSGSIRIYPVPAKERLFIEDTNQDMDIRIVNLLDMKGNKVKTLENIHQSRLSISVADLPAGFYFLETISKDQTRQRYKVIVT